MIFLLGLVNACDVGQVADGNGCIDICHGKYFNNQTKSCQDFVVCQSWEYLNLTANSCQSSCSNGYFLNGTCTCYAGFKIYNSSCVYSDTSTPTRDYLLGLDWFIWGLITILALNSIYFVCCYINYRYKKSKQLKLTRI